MALPPACRRVYTEASAGFVHAPQVCIAMTFFTSDDHTVPRDTREVLAASCLLQITEFHLFELAYARWFGRPAKEGELEECFARYMFAHDAPFWVRQYCRDVEITENDGILDPGDFGVVPREVPDTWARRGLRHVSVLMLLVITLHLVAILISTG